MHLPYFGGKCWVYFDPTGPNIHHVQLPTESVYAESTYTPVQTTRPDQLLAESNYTTGTTPHRISLCRINLHAGPNYTTGPTPHRINLPPNQGMPNQGVPGQIVSAQARQLLYTSKTPTPSFTL